MRTIGGGTVKYVDVQLLPCPEQPAHVGQVVAPARLDVLWHGRVVETFALHIGDELLVADGAEVEPGTYLTARGPGTRMLRAAIPEGVEALVLWSIPTVEHVDEVTGLRRLTFAETRAVIVELIVEGATIAKTVAWHARPIVRSGDVVRRGDPLASLSRHRSMRELETGIETVRAYLDARDPTREPIALVAPCDATVIDIGWRLIVLRTHGNRVLHLRRPPHSYPIVEIGDSVAAGEALTNGERNHHALLHAWGEHRFGEHLMDELSLFLGNKVPRVYWALALRAMVQGGKLRGIRAIARARRRSSVQPVLLVREQDRGSDEEHEDDRDP